MNKVLKNKNFALLFWGNLVSSIGTQVYNFAISWYILVLTDSNKLQQGLYLATGGFVFLILAPFGGVIVDRLDKVKIVYITDFIRGLVISVAGLLIFMDLSVSTTLVILYICTIVLSINGAIFGPAVGSLQTEVVKEEDLQTAQATMSMIRSVQGISGPLLGGIIYAIGVKWIFIINGLSYIFSGISELFIKHKFDKQFEDKLSFTSGMREFKEGVSYLRSIKGLLPLMVAALFLNFAFVPMFSNGMPVLFESILEKQPIQLSFIEVSMSVGTLVGAIVISGLSRNLSVKKAATRGLIYMTGLFIITTVLIYLVINNYISYNVFFFNLIAVMLLDGLVNMYLNIPVNTAFVRKISADYRGRAFGVINTLSMAATPLAMVLGGVILQYSGIITLGVFSTIILVLIMIVILSNKSINYFLSSCDDEDTKEESPEVLALEG